MGKTAFSWSETDTTTLVKFVPRAGTLALKALHRFWVLLRTRSWKTSPSNVDVNLGLRYVTVECNCADTDKNFNSAGKGSKVIATVPVTSEQSLNSTVTYYEDIYSEVSVANGDHGNFEFNVDTNIGKDVA